MPRVPGCEAVYEVADQWRDRCLKRDGSLLWPDQSESTWDVETLAHARNIMGELIDSRKTRGGHMEARMAAEPDQVKRAIADAVAVWELCPGSMTADERKGFVNYVATWASEPPYLELVNAAIDSNIGAKESEWFLPGFQLHRGAHLRYILELGRRVKTDGVDASSYQQMRQLCHEIRRKFSRSASVENMVLHMLFPDRTEPIFNNWARDRIAETPEFGRFFDASDDFDDAVASIRLWYSKQLGRDDFDFYDPELRNIWRPPADSNELSGTQDQEANSADDSPRLKQYWWVNQGDSYSEERNGGYLWAGRLNRAGHSIWHHETMREVRPGDLIVHYANSHLRAIGKVMAAIEEQDRPTSRQPEAGSSDGYRLEVDYRELIPPVKVDQLSLKFRLAAIPPFNSRGDVQQVYLVPLEPAWISKLFRQHRNAWPDDPDFQPLGDHSSEPFGFDHETPTLSDLAKASHLTELQLEEIGSILEAKKQVIFEGPPGSGKTYVARLFARYLAGLPLDAESDERIEIVQFHQSYGYEDFVAGIRPVTNENGQLTYRSQPGIFVEMCERAASRPDETFVLIIDEINRGNLSRIFGELLYGLEYRDQPIRLQTPVEVDGRTIRHLQIPANLYLIGTMNSTDRSLAMIDYALRRRFYFWRLMPTTGSDAPVLRQWLAQQVDLTPQDRSRLIDAFVALNADIAQTLGEDFQVGHSYLMLPGGAIGDPAALERVWRHAIEPLLREYFHTSPNVSAIIDGLRAGFLQLPVEPEVFETSSDLEP